MNLADSQYLRQWQAEHDFLIDMAFNGIGHSVEIVDSGSDPMGDDLIANQSSYRWINHTWNHQYLGCVQVFTTIPWQCGGPTTPVWVDSTALGDDVGTNLTWAQSQGIAVDPEVLVTGEHSGLRQ
ncbi:MAG: hypothetical protein M9922_12155 [Microthrixaceae bacterium]|nr:hypothetical protein [Microthrixaceae bacterium]